MMDRENTDKIFTLLSYIKERSILVKLDQKICEEAAELSIKEKLHAVDSLIYLSSLLNNCTLITADKDFKDLEKVIIIT